MVGSFHRQDEGIPQRVQAINAIRRRPRAFLEYRQSPQIFCLNPQGQHALVIHQTVSFWPALFSSRGVRFLMRQSHVIYPQKSPTKTKAQHVEKDRINGLRHSTKSKSPRGTALTTLACDTPRKSCLRVQPDQHYKCAKSKSFPKKLSVQKSPMGAAGLSAQKSPKGAAGIAQQVRKIEVFSKRLSVQKSLTGVA
jgi:hypothetical protein